MAEAFGVVGEVNEMVAVVDGDGEPATAVDQKESAAKRTAALSCDGPGGAPGPF